MHSILIVENGSYFCLEEIRKEPDRAAVIDCPTYLLFLFLFVNKRHSRAVCMLVIQMCTRTMVNADLYRATSTHTVILLPPYEQPPFLPSWHPLIQYNGLISSPHPGIIIILWPGSPIIIMITIWQSKGHQCLNQLCHTS